MLPVVTSHGAFWPRQWFNRDRSLQLQKMKVHSRRHKLHTYNGRLMRKQRQNSDRCSAFRPVAISETRYDYYLTDQIMDQIH